MRAVLWIWPVRSWRGCPACSFFWSSVLMSMQGINMVRCLALFQDMYSFTGWFILTPDCFGFIPKGKTPLLHAFASSDGLTVHNIENIELLLQRGTDCETAFIFTLPSCPLSNRIALKPLHSGTCVSMHTCPPVCIFRSK